jgi:malate dehydrogenase
VGAPTSFYLGALSLADEILMIGGRRQNLVKQHSMDIGTAVSPMGVNIRTGGYEDMAGSDIVINSAVLDQGFIKDRMDLLPKNIGLAKEILEKIKRYCPEALLITVTVPVDPLNYAASKITGFDRSKLIGYSANDTFRFHEMLAGHLNVTPPDVEGMVIGEHGNTQVMLFSTVKVDGRPVVIDEDVKQSIRAEVPEILKRFEELKSGRTSGWTCAVGLAQIVRAITQGTGEIIPCSVMLQGEYGQSDLSMGVPVVFDSNGVKEIIEYDLAPDEQEGVKITAEALRAAQRIVDSYLSD